MIDHELLIIYLKTFILVPTQLQCHRLFKTFIIVHVMAKYFDKCYCKNLKYPTSTKYICTKKQTNIFYESQGYIWQIVVVMEFYRLESGGFYLLNVTLGAML